MNAKIDLFCFKIYFLPLILWTQNKLEIPNFQLDYADKRYGLTNNLRNIGAIYEFLYNSDEAENCICIFLCSLRLPLNYISANCCFNQVIFLHIFMDILNFVMPL